MRTHSFKWGSLRYKKLKIRSGMFPNQPIWRSGKFRIYSSGLSSEHRDEVAQTFFFWMCFLGEILPKRILFAFDWTKTELVFTTFFRINQIRKKTYLKLIYELKTGKQFFKEFYYRACVCAAQVRIILKNKS